MRRGELQCAAIGGLGLGDVAEVAKEFGAGGVVEVMAVQGRVEGVYFGQRRCGAAP